MGTHLGIFHGRVNGIVLQDGACKENKERKGDGNGSARSDRYGRWDMSKAMRLREVDELRWPKFAPSLSIFGNSFCNLYEPH